MKKIFSIALMLITVLTYSVFFLSSHALETYVLGDDIDFANSQGQGYINTERQDDGSIDVTLNSQNPSNVRMYYAASGTEQYRVDLRNFTFKFSVNSMVTGATYKLAFLKNWDDFPLDQWGTGLGFLMQDDNGGSYNVLPHLYTGGVGESNDSSKNWYLVYDNSSRPSHLGKVITLHTEDAGDDILVTMSYDEDSGNQVSYSNLFPKSYFTDRGMDITSVLFMFGINNNNGQDFEFTVHDIVDNHTQSYLDSKGSAAREVFADITSIDTEDEEISVADIKEYFRLEKAISTLSNLRKADRFAKAQSETTLANLLSTYEAAVVAEKTGLFGDFDEAFEVTEQNLADSQFALYIYNQTKEVLDDEELDGLMTLLLDKIVAYDYSDDIEAVENTITEFLEEYAIVSSSNYLQAKADYQVILAEYQSLDAQIRQFVSNKEDLLAFEEKLNNGKDLYYSNEGTKWQNYNEELHFARSVMVDAKTKILLVDDYGNTRVYYGDHLGGYALNLEEFSMKFVIDALEDSGRFAINFGKDIDMIANAEVGKAGLSIVFRSVSNGAIDVALKDTATDLGTTFGTPLDMWGKYGNISATSMRGVEIVLSFVKSGSNYVLKFEVSGGTGFEVTVPNKYFSDRGLNPNELSMNITTGEGGNHNNNKDIELSIVEISGKGETDYNSFVEELETELVVLIELYDKLVAETATDDEIVSFNQKMKSLSLEGLRASDLERLTELFDDIILETADEKVAKIVSDKINALPEVITASNYEAVLAAIEEIEAILEQLSVEQDALVTVKARINDTKDKIETYEGSLVPVDPGNPDDKEDEEESPMMMILIIIGSIVALAAVSIATVVLIKKRK